MGELRVTWDPARTPIEALFRRTTWQRREALAETMNELAPNATVCDLGSGGRRLKPDALCVDLLPGAEIDLVADVHALPLENDRFDLVVATGVLNHCREPLRAIGEMYRITKPGGLVHLEVPLCMPVIEVPEDHWRITPPGLKSACADVGFQVVRQGTHIGPGSAFAANVVFGVSALVPGDGKRARAVRAITHGLVCPLKFIDAVVPQEVLDRLPTMYGHFYVGRKPLRG